MQISTIFIFICGTSIIIEANKCLIDKNIKRY